MIRSKLLLVAFVLLAVNTAFAESDAAGCGDVFVSRLSGFFIKDCDVKEFDSFTFAEGESAQTRVEGRIITNNYGKDDDGHPVAPLQVRRNYETALKDAGWKVVYMDPDTLVEKQVQDGFERWVQLASNGGDYYTLILAVKGGMEQSVTTAAGMQTQLNSNGRVALNINFDTGKSTIRPESQDIIAQIVTLMKNTPALKLSVEGHTDSTGAAASNLTLSQSRAQAVVGVLVAGGIAADRLTSAGFGQTKPVADNTTESGRALNRRVELVKK